MIEEFCDWFIDFVYGVVGFMIDAFWNTLKFAFCALVAVLTSPVWLIPFLYWHFRKWKKDKEPET